MKVKGISFQPHRCLVICGAQFWAWWLLQRWAPVSDFILCLSAAEGEQICGVQCQCGKRTDKVSPETFLPYHQEILRVYWLQGTLNGKLKRSPVALGTSLCRSHFVGIVISGVTQKLIKTTQNQVRFCNVFFPVN